MPHPLEEVGRLEPPGAAGVVGPGNLVIGDGRRLPSLMEGLGTFRARDPSTNLNGAIVEGIKVLKRQMRTSSAPLTFGTLVIFTDGTDHAHRVTSDQLDKVLEEPGVDILAIGIGSEIDAVARILLGRPDVLLLDEPTNYLDLESILWLEGFLRDYPGTVLMTCHDRDVMNGVVRKIVEIDGGQIRSYSGNYDFYEQARPVEAERREAESQRQQAMLAKESRFIERFKAQVAWAGQVQSRIRRLEKIERIEPPRRLQERRFDFPRPPRSGEDVIKVAGASG